MKSIKITLIILLFGSLGYSQTNVSGFISSNTTWTLAGSPYIVVGNVLLDVGITLTIEPAVVVKFQSDKVLQIKGELIAQGTSSNIITFTSDESNPNTGDWGKIIFSDESVDASFSGTTYTGGCILEYCTIEYGSGVLLNLGNPFINYCTIKHNNGIGIQMNSHDTNNGNATIRITNNTINNNSGGIWTLGYGTVTIDNNTVNNNTDHGITSAAYNSTVSNNSIKNNNGTGLIGGSYSGSFTNNIITGNNSIQAGGIEASGGGLFSNNIIYGNVGFGAGGVYIQGGETTFTKNIVVGNITTEGDMASELYLEMGGNNISFNVFASTNDGLGYAVVDYSGGDDNMISVFVNNAIIGYSGSEIVYKCEECSYGTYQYNLFSQNEPNGFSTIFFLSGVPSVFSYNNIINNTASNLLQNNNNIGTDVTAEYNYWGTTSPSDIASSIYDWFDDGTLGMVDYDPYLTSPDTDAPISPPANVLKQTSGSDVIITWDANPESDLAGYNVYWGSPTGYSFANVVDVGNVTTYTLSGVSIADTIAVTAYDMDLDGTDDQVEGNESWFAIEPTSLGTKDDDVLSPTAFTLKQNYPNPFNPVTTISYQLPKTTFVNLSIYNVVGQLIETLVNEYDNAGLHTVEWNASRVGSGVYFYRIEAGEYTETKKCLILK